MFRGKLAEQVVGQLIPAGLLATIPLSVPAMATLTPSPVLKLAETLAASLMV